MIISGTKLVGGKHITLGIITDGLVVNLDASSFSSSPGSGAAWTNQVAGPTFTLPNGATYSSSNSGIITFARSSQQSAHGTSPGSALTTFTAETWVNLDTIDNTAGNATCTITEVYNNTPINYAISNGLTGSPNVWQGGYFAGGAWHLAGTFTPTANTWYCMAVTYDGTNVKFYVNGALDATTASAVTPGSSGLGINIGERWDVPNYPLSFLNGSVPVVRVYNQALTAAQVLQNYNANRSRFGL